MIKLLIIEVNDTLNALTLVILEKKY